MITIGAAARQTGIGEATLRKWESRYGFPIPERTAGDHRTYKASDLAALIEISRRMAAGQRAGAAIQAVKQDQQQAMPKTVDSAVIETPEVSHALALLLQKDLQSVEDFMASHRAQHGAAEFARKLAVPMTSAVGNLWQRGKLPVYVEHLFSGILQKVVLLNTVRPTRTFSSAPQVLLASPAGEGHTLALALLNDVLTEVGISTVFLQGSLPAAEIAEAAKAFKVQVVALSASVVCPPKLLTTELRSLRALLEDPTALWVGGAGTHRISTRLDGITVMTSLDDALQTLKTSFAHNPNLIG